MCWSLVLIKLEASVIESLLWFTGVLCFYFRNHTQNNQLIRKTSLKLIKFIVQSYLFIAFEFFFLLVLSTFPVFLKRLNNNFFRYLAYKSLLSEFQCYNELYYVVFESSFLHPAVCYVFHQSHFSGSMFFSACFQGLGPGSGSRFCMVALYACSPVNVLHIFITVSHKITSRGLLPNIVTNKREGR